MNNTDTHHNNNGSTDDSSDNEDNSTPETIIIINCVLNAPLMLISILSNALVLAAIIRTPSIRSTHVIVLCSLAVSDFLVGFVAQPMFIAEQLTQKPLPAPRFSDDGVFFMWSFSLDSNSHHWGSISGSSLSHEICYFSD